MELYKGRPETNEGRQAREIRVYDFLDAHGIEYMRTDHEPADTMEDMEKYLEAVHHDMIKVTLTGGEDPRNL